MLTPKQIALIHLATKRLGFDDEIYRAILMAHGGVASAKELDFRGFERVMAYFTAHGFRSTWTSRTFGERPGMASPKQVDLIRSLWAQWSEDGEETSLNAWLEKSFQVSALRFLPSPLAAKAITGLKAMVRRKRGARRVIGASSTDPASDTSPLKGHLTP